MTKYPKELIQWIKNNCYGKSYNELIISIDQLFGLKLTSKNIKTILSNYHLSTGRTGHFTKGHQPHNKGKKWTEYVSEEGMKKSLETCFTTGKNINNQNHTWRNVGEERIDKNGYTYVKTKNHERWELKHHLVWREHNGEIPEGHKVIFADGNIKNFNIENLILISNGELAIMNKNGLYYKGYPDITKTGALISKVNYKIIKRRKQR